MSNPNTFNGDLKQTEIGIAYLYQTYSPYVYSTNIFNPEYSVMCIFCSSNDTTSLTADGSFKNCKTCKKHFRAKILEKQK
uniref:Uncharacterized protein n=1 Tax=viral metagenome TaxID=1070528 RepID=A0A6C0LJH0_9ZZZZ